LLHSKFNERQGQFSADGKWIAYVSDESGSPQVYVQSFPTLTGKWQVSSGEEASRAGDAAEKNCSTSRRTVS